MQDIYKNIGWSVLAGVLAGALFALVSKGSALSVLGFSVSPVPIAAAGLVFGYTGLAMACVVGIVVLSALAGPSNAMLYAMWDIVPVVVLTGLLLKNRENEDGKKVWYPIGYALSWTSIVTAIIGMTVTYMLLLLYSIDNMPTVAENAEDTAAVISQNLLIDADLQETMLKFLSETAAPSLSANFPNYESALKNISVVFMALMSMAWFFRIVFAVWITEYALVRKGKALRANPEYIPMYIQNWFLVLIVIAGLVAAFGTSANLRYLAANFAFAICLPFCLSGLCQIHIWARSVPYTKVILTVFYVLLSLPLFIGYGMMEALGILAVIGLYEQIVRIYKRYIRPLENGEK